MNVFQISSSARAVSDSSLRKLSGVLPAGALSLGIGEPDFPTPQFIVDEMVWALRRGVTTYGDFNGDAELRNEIAEHCNRLGAGPVTSESVLITHGGTSALSAAIFATVGRGDRVIIPEPTYSLYADLVRLAGGDPVFVPLLKNHQLDLQAILDAARYARLLVLCNPGNPTGVTLSALDLEVLGRALEGTDCLVVADEAYSAFAYDEQFVSIMTIPSLWRRAIYCQTFSKTFAMTGWRVGYLVAPSQVAPWIMQVHRGLTSSINSAVQRAALAAFRSGPGAISEHVARYDRRRQEMIARLKAMPGLDFVTPNSAFYALVKYPGKKPSLQMLTELREAGVIVRAGIEYGPSGEGSVRLSFAVSKSTLELALNRVEEVFARHV